MHVVRWYSGGGVRCQNLGSFLGRPTVSRRGSCEGFSQKSSARLRMFLIKYYIPDKQTWAVTLTVRDFHDTDVWRDKWSVFSQRQRQNRVPLVWRVELTRRQRPHLHCVVWGSTDDIQRLRLDWLQVWGVENDYDHVCHAVDFRKMENEYWLCYIALHIAKKTEQSVGWKGRAWGVVCRLLFVERSAIEYCIPDEIYAYYVRFMSRILHFRGRRRNLPPCASWDSIGLDYLTSKCVFERCMARARRSGFLDFPTE